MRSIKPGKTIKPGNVLSDIDIEEIKLLYNCKNTAKLTSKKATVAVKNIITSKNNITSKKATVAVKNNIKKSLTFNIK
jgi:hypothetical protein